MGKASRRVYPGGALLENQSSMLKMPAETHTMLVKTP